MSRCRWRAGRNDREHRPAPARAGPRSRAGLARAPRTACVLVRRQVGRDQPHANAGLREPPGQHQRRVGAARQVAHAQAGHQDVQARLVRERGRHRNVQRVEPRQQPSGRNVAAGSGAEDARACGNRPSRSPSSTKWTSGFSWPPRRPGWPRGRTSRRNRDADRGLRARRPRDNGRGVLPPAISFRTWIPRRIKGRIEPAAVGDRAIRLGVDRTSRIISHTAMARQATQERARGARDAAGEAPAHG